jgi:hypothetical protein
MDEDICMITVHSLIQQRMDEDICMITVHSLIQQRMDEDNPRSICFVCEIPEIGALQAMRAQRQMPIDGSGGFGITST